MDDNGVIKLADFGLARWCAFVSTGHGASPCLKFPHIKNMIAIFPEIFLYLVGFILTKWWRCGIEHQRYICEVVYSFSSCSKLNWSSTGLDPVRRAILFNCYWRVEPGMYILWNGSRDSSICWRLGNWPIVPNIQDSGYTYSRSQLLFAWCPDKNNQTKLRRGQALKSCKTIKDRSRNGRSMRKLWMQRHLPWVRMVLIFSR